MSFIRNCKQRVQSFAAARRSRRKEAPVLWVVKIIISRVGSRYSWRWELVQPRKVSKWETSQIEMMVEQYCSDRMSSEPPGDYLRMYCTTFRMIQNGL